MTLKYKDTNFENPVLISYFIPKPLKSQNIYEAFVRSRKKKEVDLEFREMLIYKTEQQFNCLKRLENRFDIYGKALPNEGQVYTFRFKLFDNTSKLVNFSDRKKRLQNISSYIYAYNSRRHILKNITKNIKSRLLCLTKGGFKISFFGQKVILFNTMIKATHKKTSYDMWIISNLKYIGSLNFYNLQKWEINMDKNPSAFTGKKSILYYKDFSLNSLIILDKNINEKIY
uniref:Uncharacterized protein n=1 Tax=Nannochloropsis oceanica TaxID=145522 RepID=A0A023PL40_9STRA|nr:hypothetical protein NaonMp0029 [Nannochloropsis oceanica]